MGGRVGMVGVVRAVRDAKRGVARDARRGVMMHFMHS